MLYADARGVCRIYVEQGAGAHVKIRTVIWKFRKVFWTQLCSVGWDRTECR